MKAIINIIINTDIKELSKIFSEPGKIYTFLNPVSYLQARRNKSVYYNFDGVFADGSILVLFIKLLYRKSVKRRSFDMTSVAPALFDYCVRENKSIYLIGSTDDEVKHAIRVLKENYPISIDGRNGFFKSEDEKLKAIEEILIKTPDYLIVGMGVPKQEYFLTKVKECGFTGIGFTCGGFIHQTAKRQISYYPPWIDRYNLRFIYRMIKEKHTRRRYLVAGYLFPVIFCWDKITKR